MPLKVPVAQTGEESEIGQLTQALTAGDDEAFRRFHDCYSGRLYRYLFVVLRGDPQAAADALQETFVRVGRHIRPFDTEEKLWSWLTVLARSAAADLSRRKLSYWRLLTRYAASWRLDRAAPSEGLAQELIHGALQEELARLPEPERTLVHGKYILGTSVRALAAEQGLTGRAVESRLARVRQHLREQISKKLRHE